MKRLACVGVLVLAAVGCGDNAAKQTREWIGDRAEVTREWLGEKYQLVIEAYQECIHGGCDLRSAIQGPDGNDGEAGEPGTDGETGKPGTVGVKGTAGADGEQGPKGDKGDQGDQGEQGEQGPAGEDGVDGEDGVSSIVAVVDPCGDRVDYPDEIVFVFADGTVVGYLEDNGREMIAVLEPGVHYTNDKQRCRFTVLADGTIQD